MDFRTLFQGIVGFFPPNLGFLFFFKEIDCKYEFMN